MSREVPRHAAPKHARKRAGKADAALTPAPVATDITPRVHLAPAHRHRAVRPARSRRLGGLAAATAAVVAVAGGGYAVANAPDRDVVAPGLTADLVVVAEPTAQPTVTGTATPTEAPTAAATPTPTPSAKTKPPKPAKPAGKPLMTGKGKVTLSKTTLDARERAAAKKRADDLARSTRSGERTALASGSPKDIAKTLMLAEYGWGDGQFSCLVSLWNRESMWNPRASNPSSGAHGIPQSLPGSKMAKFGSDWRTNPSTQIKWGLWYIKSRYGTPCGAWSFWQRGSWY